MADSLLLRLSNGTPAEASWLLLGAAPAIPQRGPLSLAAARAGGRPVIVLVPGTDVLLTRAELPPTRSSVKLQQLVPFALEEQLAEDIDTLHFAIGRPGAPGVTPVAVVARKRMDEWLSALRAAGIEPAAFYADSQLLPRNPTQAVALLEGEAVTVRTPSGEGVTLSAEALPEALELARADETTRGMILYTGAAEWQRHGAAIEALRERLEALTVQRLPGDALELLARGLGAPEAINLLQGRYAPSRSLIAGLRAWRWAAVLLVALIAVHLLGQGLELVALHRRERALDASIAAVFSRAMPGETLTSEARRQMAQRLAAVRAARSGGGFLSALGALAAAHAGTGGSQLRSLQFDSGAVTLSITAPSVEVLNGLAQSLAAQGWQAHLTGGSVIPGGFQGGIHMDRGH